MRSCASIAKRALDGPETTHGNHREADIAMLHPGKDFYTKSHPTPQDVLLLIELAESSLRYDRDVKLRLYARHGIPTLWLADLENKQSLQFSKPTESRYQVMTPADISRPITLPGIGGVEVDLAGMF